ncbi:hypothetical protein [Caulobacter sp. NIBR1757]|uniref:hypothetical protein n=1 Tax=Caulobacter sp. NIBR1757 TaxID=3016000 RepID=UPI0022F0520A|nr:hypothetical protein [Caulobacter sp. NIBR1757]WGM38173.1 hypothetical protein AMEJIAPC_01075 [Caulobacter sp. NIBR1757]
MKKLIVGAAALALAAAAMPALAGDLLYEAAPDSLTENLNGQPYWSAQAQCAGLFGAAAQYLTDRGDTAGADASSKLAVTFANDAIKRLVKDRGLTRKEALVVIEPAVLKARTDSMGLVSSGDTSAKSTWNFARSSCLDVAEAYTQVSY